MVNTNSYSRVVCAYKQVKHIRTRLLWQSASYSSSTHHVDTRLASSSRMHTTSLLLLLLLLLVVVVVVYSSFAYSCSINKGRGSSFKVQVAVFSFFHPPSRTFSTSSTYATHSILAASNQRRWSLSSSFIKWRFLWLRSSRSLLLPTTMKVLKKASALTQWKWRFGQGVRTILICPLTSSKNRSRLLLFVLVLSAKGA